MPETCANCERKIGNLETPMVFNDSTVCKDCYKSLAEDETDAISADLNREDRQQRHPLAPPPTKAPRRVCPACGSGLPAVRRAKGSRIVLIAALCFGILPGLLYMVFYSGYVFACPKCGYRYGDAQ